MQFESVWHNNELFFSGELSFDSVIGLEQKQKELFAGRHALTVDLNAVTRCDSAGLALLVCWLNYARKNNINLSFVNPSQQLLAIAQISGVANILGLE